MALSEMYDHMVRWECLPFRIPGEKRKEKQRKEKKRKEKKKREWKILRSSAHVGGYYFLAKPSPVPQLMATETLLLCSISYCTSTHGLHVWTHISA